MEPDLDALDKELTDEMKRYEENKRKRKFFRNHKLKGQHKRFNTKLHNRYDIPARNILKEKLEDFLVDNPDEYQQDMIINSKKCKYRYLEIQVCSIWEKREYPFPSVFVYERKAKYGNDTLFITLNRFMTRGLIFDRKSFQDSKPRRLKKYSREFVYDVPWRNVVQVEIEHLDKETFEMY